MEATDRLMAAGVTLREMAEALGVVHNTVRVARMDPSKPSYRRPPPDWQAVLGKLARQRGAELHGIAARLERVR